MLATTYQERFLSDASSQVVRLVATHRRLGRVARRALAIDWHHGRNGMFENKLRTWTRVQQNCKLVKAGQLTAQSDAVHEEHVYGGLFFDKRL